MRIVLDSCVALKWVLPESDSPKALALRAEFQLGIHDLLAPDVFPAEVAHALLRAERRNLVQNGEVHLANVLSTPPDFHSSLPLLLRAYDIASQRKCGAYDCLYVALAEREQVELVTSDKKMINALQRHFPFIVDLASLP